MQLNMACAMVPSAGGETPSWVNSVLLRGGTLAVAVICAANVPLGPVLSIASVADELANPHGDAAPVLKSQLVTRFPLWQREAPPVNWKLWGEPAALSDIIT